MIRKTCGAIARRLLAMVFVPKEAGYA